ncbi:MAG: rod shape-determining protein RodA [Elusimicrobia bacterium]|nr:rod shape-determining protein RodA [Elusimicrobiota bacterium]
MMLRTDSAGMRGKVDWLLIFAAVGLVLIGSVMILSAASPLLRYPQIVQRHVMALLLGGAAFLFGLGMHYQVFQDQSRVLYALTLAILVAVLVFGETVRGHRSWIRLPLFAFQPSEVTRICMILVLANYLDRRHKQIERLGTLMGAIGVAVPIVTLLLLQPDFSSAALLFPVIIAMLFCTGGSLGHIASITGCAGVAVALTLLESLSMLHPEWSQNSGTLQFVGLLSRSNGWLAVAAAAVCALTYLAYRASLAMRFRYPPLYYWVTAGVLVSGLCAGIFINRNIKEYQRNRFLVFLAPESDPQEAGYHVNQALVAIGSGGVTGKGIFSGTQSQLGFLPERHTDFIFAVIGEEMGFLGAAAVLGLYLLLMGRIVHAARLSRDRYGFLVCTGLTAMFGAYFMVNVGMCLGVIPVAGIPLPLVSYGGSSLVASLWAVGIVANIYSKRYAFA